MVDSPHRHSSPITSEKQSSPRPRSPPRAQAQPNASKNTASTRVRPLVDVIGTQFPAFDCESAVIFPFQDETARDEAFQKGMLTFRLPGAKYPPCVSGASARTLKDI